MVRQEKNVDQAGEKRRRWTVITSGLLVGALALVVTFTNRSSFSSPVAVVVIAAVGVMALLLQLRLRFPERASQIQGTAWLNIAGVLLALAAFLADLNHVREGLAETVALASVGCFGISGALVLHDLRKRRTGGE
jgi:drug/metabolite transporter (DMT)-like permease